MKPANNLGGETNYRRRRRRQRQDPKTSNMVSSMLCVFRVAYGDAVEERCQSAAWRGGCHVGSLDEPHTSARVSGTSDDHSGGLLMAYTLC